jgi:hypothetical protein
MNLPARNLICLRDPNFEKHGWHAGHITRIKATSARQDYKTRQRSKEVGGKAYRIICDMEHYWKMKLTFTQKHMLYVYISNALWFETMFLN